MGTQRICLIIIQVLLTRRLRIAIGNHIVQSFDMMMGTIPGSVETSFIAILIGAPILIATGIGSWRIILSTFVGGLLAAALFIMVRCKRIDGNTC